MNDTLELIIIIALIAALIGLGLAIFMVTVLLSFEIHTLTGTLLTLIIIWIILASVLAEVAG